MDPASLRAYLAVAEHGSFSLAAEALHLTQPAVSKRIATLESELGERLFDRVGRGAKLTAAGINLMPHAHGVLDGIARARAAVAASSVEVAGRLSVATSHHIGLHRLPPVLRTFIGRYPRVELDLSFLASEAAWAAVGQSRLELAIVTLPLREDPLLALTPIWEDPLVPVATPSRLGAVRPLDALTTLPAILPARGTTTRTLIDRACTAAGLSPRVRLETDHLETIRMLVSVGFGWSVLPRSLVGPSVTEIDVPQLRMTRQLGIVRHRRREESPAARALISACRSSEGAALAPNAEGH